MWTHPAKHNPNKYYLYYRDHNHDTEYYIQLYDEIEALFRKGWLDRFIKHQLKRREDHPRVPPQLEPSRWDELQGERPHLEIINTIAREHQQGEARASAELAKKQRIKEPIIFTKEDVRRVQLSPNDVDVVTSNIADYDVRCILIDNKSSTDVLFYYAFSKMSIFDSRMDPMNPHQQDSQVMQCWW